MASEGEEKQPEAQEEQPANAETAEAPAEEQKEQPSEAEATAEKAPDEGGDQIPPEAPPEAAQESEAPPEVSAAADDEYEIQDQDMDADIPSISAEESSKTKVALGSIISLRKTGVEGGYYDRRVARFANSYKLNSDNPFHVEKVEKLLDEVLLEAMENLQYDPDICPKQAKWACSMIRAKVKEMEFDRYKILTIVSIGEKRAQDILYTIRFLWDEERDKLAMSTHENMYIFGVAICLGIYYE